MYHLSNDEIKINEKMKIADSLRIEAIKYQRQYDSLLITVSKLDSIIANQEEKIKIIKDTFIIYKTPPFNNADSAFKYLNDFIKE